MLAAVQRAQQNFEPNLPQAQTPPAPAAMGVIERIEPVQDTNSSDPARQEAAYAEARLDVPPRDLHSLPTSLLAQLVLQVVEQEGPVHFDELTTRMRTLWGLQRAGSRVRDALDAARQSLLADGVITAETDFLDLPGRTVRVRDRSAVSSANLRRPDCLPPTEVRQAIKQALQSSLGGQRDELPAAVARMLGLNAVTASVRELILGQLDALHHSAEVRFNGTLYQLPA